MMMHPIIFRVSIAGFLLITERLPSFTTWGPQEVVGGQQVLQADSAGVLLVLSYLLLCRSEFIHFLDRSVIYAVTLESIAELTREERS